jgi:hypothetical protein
MTYAANRRRSGLVIKQFQIGMAWRFLIAFLVLSFLGTTMIFAPSLKSVAMENNLSEIDRSASELLVLHRRIWPAALFVAAGMFLYTLWISRRIAGPVYRINAVLRQMLDGNPPPSVKLREGDFLQETAGLLEELARRERTAGREPAGGPPGRPVGGETGGGGGE